VRLTILVLEDERPVREALARDLAPLVVTVRVEAAEDVPDAWQVVEEVDEDGDVLALVLADHRLPGDSGVDLLVAMLDDPRTAATRKVLVTGQADQQDTIRAVNQAGLDHYIAKPWDPDVLREVVRDQLTEFVLDERLDPLPHLRALDAARAMDRLRDRGDR
jgi:response regulator RpfG family c-di-GMP phosphodiesterase